MRGTIELYKLAFTPNDTMYFNSTESQNAWFESQEHLTIDDISFNGARAFQLGSNYLDIIFQYNYVRYQLNGRYIYAFIENVDYTNDNCCSLQVSIDLNQTFLRELQSAIVTSNVGNITKKDSEFINNYIPYDNKMVTSDYDYHLVSDLAISNGKFKLGFIMANTDKNVLPLNTIFRDNGFLPPSNCILLPVLYNTENKRLYTEFATYFYDGSQNQRIMSGFDLGLLQSQFSNLLVDNCVSINFNSVCFASSVVVNYDEASDFISSCQIACRVDKTDLLNVCDINIGPLKLLALGNNKYYYNFNVNLNQYLQNIPYALYRQPYIFIRIGNDIEYFTLNLLDFKNPNNNTHNKILKVSVFTSGCYPFVSNFSFKFNECPITIRNAMFNCASGITVPFSLSAWQEYYSRHSASVNDGLATKQKYERVEDVSKLGLNLINSALNLGTSMIPYTKAGNFYKRPHKVTDRSVVNAGVGGFTDLLSAGVNYANSELERDKEKALLSIEWNDIQSSPSEYSNIMSNLSLYYANGYQGVEIDLCIARNINDIIKYHKQYGYKVNRMETLSWSDIRQHTVFDYISFNTITLKSTLPQFYTAMIEQQYEQGVRFWYDYNNFMNFEIENEEVV